MFDCRLLMEESFNVDCVLLIGLVYRAVVMFVFFIR